MQPLRYSINITLDGCCDHREGTADEELHRRAADTLARADALIFGRVTYGMMEEGWRPLAETGVKADWMADWMMPFAQTIHAAKKYLVSDTVTTADWNTEIVRGPNLLDTIRQLKQQPGRGLLVGGVTLPLALMQEGLIDEYEFVVHPRIAGHGPTLFAGLSNPANLELIGRVEYQSGAVALQYRNKAS